MDFTQFITLLTTAASFGDFFRGFGATLSGSADLTEALGILGSVADSEV